MNFRRKFSLQIPRSFVAARTGGNPRLSSGLGGSPRSNARPRRPSPNPRFDYIMGGAPARNVKYGIKGLGEDMKKTMEENGMSRELWEAKIAQVKEKIKSGSASED